ncbi:dihydropyrimidine dehydrogenase, chloroplastic [Pycnococcus provasolii]|uniref:dihydropyrimidine dehydrogenase (NADP(+)) n=1 Tax=Pycnococcus provasolii TaxID=41880 RepID=A0A830HMG8_9CHLO|nr:dihydropyrimidine dehydrogenase, chloroplastic [Pycnococcus provasolii]|eukprot:CAMPEP_0205957510 /NCGR_PEP_ID=MMETSP1459-20131121/44271_1 /ASSEMBLY_ACC=CAM_ASM_001120 /TAXON_ID=41880 /ORGANISM="Pycnococcus provasolii, Strain RCC931" /LENGTH=447 /DNA_ID=CAMNT_0053329977 /DNA_START=13 /DNA_END=1356 /DNA_ORIENTATION=+
MASSHLSGSSSSSSRHCRVVSSSQQQQQRFRNSRGPGRSSWAPPWVAMAKAREASEFLAGERVANLKDGAAVDGPDLSVTVNGIKFPNPFVIGSGPPGTNYAVMKKAFDEGWGGVICKTISLDAGAVHNVTPRYAKLKAHDNKQVLGWQNIELISDRPTEVMLAELKQLKEEYPDRVLIASLMEEYNKDRWDELIGRTIETGVDALEINFSCPHGMPERRMGAAMGQDCELLQDVTKWIADASTIPVWAKMTPNDINITSPGRVSLDNGIDGLAAINTIMSVMGINLKTLRPEPSVEGYSTPGGYSAAAVRPIALAKCMSLAKMIRDEYPGRSLSGIGGVETGKDAAEFLLIGADTVQVCTGVMLHGYPLIKTLCGGLQEFMEEHDFKSIDEFKGAALPYFTTHAELYRMQEEAIAAKKAAKVGLKNDAEWTGDGFQAETDSMVSNN